MRNAVNRFSIQRLYVIMGPWRIVWLILAAALTSVYLGPSVEPFSGYVDECAFYLSLFCCIVFCSLSVIAFFLWMFTGTVPALPRVFARHRNKSGMPKVARTVPVSEDRLANMENSYSRGVVFCQIVVCPVLISMVILVWTGRLYDYMNWRDPNDYGFYLYPVQFAALAVPWHLLYTWRGRRRCPYCLTPCTNDNFDLEHHVCLRCHTRFVAQNETEPSPAPEDKI